MLSAQIDVDLPSDLPEPPALVRKLVGWMLGRQELEGENKDAKEQLLLDNLTVFEQLLLAFGDAGFDDVVSVVIDGKPVYVDTQETIGDLQQALEGTVKSGVLDEGFSVMRATFSHNDDAMRTLAELRVHARVPEGHDECRLRISAREHDLDLQDEEGPREYAVRVREYIRDADRIERHLKKVDGMTARLRQHIGERLPGARSRARPGHVRVIAPGPRQVGRMRHLGFKSARRRTVYSALAGHERIGAYDDPMTHHYYSPYQDLFDWIALGEVLAGHWNTDRVEVVHPTGRVLFRGSQGAHYDARGLEVARDAVRVSPQGELVIDDSIPEVASLDPAEAGNPHSPGWGGEQWAEDMSDGDS